MIGRAACAGAIGLAACLLFQVQFLLARQILPWFGGAPAVWSTSLVVFQALLLAGYGWAHGLARVSRRRQVVLQMAIMALAMGVLAWRAHNWPSPVTPGDAWKTPGEGSPIRAIATLLVASVGLPFVVLASASPLLQHWRTLIAPELAPYRLYAVSNAGSLIGLVTYPWLIEPHLGIFAQGRWWAAAFVVCGLTMAVCAWHVWTAPERAEPTLPDGSRDLPQGVGRAGPVSVAAWVVLAAVPSALLQATTTRLTQDIAAVPFLWMVPLALYLISFILAFEWPEACPRRLTSILLAAGAVLSLVRWSTPVALALTLFLMAVASLALHVALARRAPAPDSLTRYYLAIASGGVAGSALVAFGAPMAFTRIIEYPVAIGVALLVLAGVELTCEPSAAHTEADGPPSPSRTRSRRASGRRTARLLAEAQVLSGLVLLAATIAESRLVADQTTYASRNFFGTVRMREMTEPDGSRYRRFIHGTTLHGLQWLDDTRRRQPTAYFTAGSGIGRAMTALTSRPDPIRVAVIGLGIGTLAAYGRTGDAFTFFEIDPQVVALSTGAMPPFTYVRDSAARVDIVVGDGRLALERTAPLRVDLLAMDAFSSDAVPVHLVTREALALYAGHLRHRTSIIAVNVSNRYLDLADVVAAAGAANGFAAVRVQAEQAPGHVQATRWMLLSRAPEVLRPFGAAHVNRSAPWIDTWSQPLAAFRW